MKNKLNFFYILFLIFLSFNCFSQGNYYEIGFGAGPVSFRGDWGEREEAKTNFGNTGFGFSLLHFINFAYGRNTYNYFNKHFKVRSHLSFYQSNLNHYGKWVEDEGAPFLLDNMSGKTSVVEVGSGLEWYWTNIRSYERQNNVFNPYAGFGFNLVYFNPTVETSLPGEIGSPTNTWPTFLPDLSGNEPITNSSEITAGINFHAGTRYRLNKSADLFIEGRWHYYFSDFVDGLKPNNPNNSSNDWVFALTIGYIYYLD